MTERRIVMFNQVSTDGCFSDAQGGVDWVVADPEIHARAIEDMPNTDAMLFGRRTYQQFASFWPQALKDMKQPGPHGENKQAGAFAAMAHWLNETKKYVFSRSMQHADWNNSELVAELTPAAIRKLKREPGRNMLIFGSGSLVSQLSEQGLIDEYRFVVCPIVLGQGKSIFASLNKRVKLELREARAFDSGNVMLVYQPSKA